MTTWRALHAASVYHLALNLRCDSKLEEDGMAKDNGAFWRIQRTMAMVKQTVTNLSRRASARITVTLSPLSSLFLL